MLFLVFPKEFEFNLFICRCKILNAVCVSDLVTGKLSFNELGHTFFLTLEAWPNAIFGLESEQNNVKVPIIMLAAYVEDSDVGFHLKLYDYLAQIEQLFGSQNLQERFTFILCGTCGGNKTTGLIGSCFRVSKAYKYDRGAVTKTSQGTTLPTQGVTFRTPNFDTRIYSPGRLKKLSALNNEGNDIEVTAHLIMELDSKKCVSKQEKGMPLPLGFNEAVALCGNFIVYCDGRLIAKKLNISLNAHVVTDMETFEFFSVCSMRKVGKYGCLRIVSDSYGLTPDIEEIEKQWAFLEEPLNLNAELKKEIIDRFRGMAFCSNYTHKVGRKSLNMEQLVNEVLKLGIHEKEHNPNQVKTDFSAYLEADENCEGDGPEINFKRRKLESPPPNIRLLGSLHIGLPAESIASPGNPNFRSSLSAVFTRDELQTKEGFDRILSILEKASKHRIDSLSDCLVKLWKRKAADQCFTAMIELSKEANPI